MSPRSPVKVIGYVVGLLGLASPPVPLPLSPIPYLSLSIYHRRFALSGMDMTASDYDGRTALHLAAAEGHLMVVRMLLEQCHVPPQPKDRYENSKATEFT